MIVGGISIPPNVDDLSIPPNVGDLDRLIRLVEALSADVSKAYLAEVKQAVDDALAAQQKAETDNKAAIALRAQVEQEIKAKRAKHDEQLAKERAEHDEQLAKEKAEHAAALKAANDDLSARAKKLEDGLKVLADRNEEPRRRVEIEQRMAHVNEALQS